MSEGESDDGKVKPKERGQSKQRGKDVVAKMGQISKMQGMSATKILSNKDQSLTGATGGPGLRKRDAKLLKH